MDLISGSQEHAKSQNHSVPHIAQLDGIRGFAILLVVLYHYIAVSIPESAGQGFQVLRQLLSNAWSGVDLFFVLSGFLIAGILIDNRKSKNYFRVFYTRRISRIFPLYYLFLLLFLLLKIVAPFLTFLNERLFYNPLPIMPYFLYFQNMAMATYGTFGNEFLAITWSLAIEEHFYLLLPLIIRWSHPKKLMFILVFFISLTLGLRMSVGVGMFLGYLFTPWRLDGLFLGAVLAIVVRTPEVINVIKEHLNLIKAAFIVFLLFMIYSSVMEPLGSLDHLFIFGILYTLLLFLSLVENSRFALFFRLPPLVKIGQISYGIYLFHQLINGLLHDLVFNNAPSFHNFPTVLITVISFILTYIVAHLTYHGLEKRFIAFGHRYSYSLS